MSNLSRSGKQRFWEKHITELPAAEKTYWKSVNFVHTREPIALPLCKLSSSRIMIMPNNNY